MFTSDSPVDLRFFTWAAPIVDDVSNRRRIEWLDDATFDGSRTGTLRGYANNFDNIAEAVIRVTLQSGSEYEVWLVDLMNAALRHGYARR